MRRAGTLYLAVSLPRYDDLCPRFGDLFVQTVGVIALGSNRGAGPETIDKIMGKGDVVALSGTGDQTSRWPERIAGDVDFWCSACVFR